MTADLPPDDLPPPAAAPTIPRGLLVACGLATVVFFLAVISALRADPGKSVARPNLTSPTPAPDASGKEGPSVAVSVPVGGIPIGADTLPAVATVGTPAPTTAFERFDGGTASLADYLGRPVVINFFSSVCAPCHVEMPELEKVHRARGDAVTFVGLNVLDSDEGARYIVEKTGVTWDLGKDRRGELVRAVGGLGLPTTVLVDPAGIIRYVHTGQIDAAELERALTEAGL